jgi:hypothetical protein
MSIVAIVVERNKREKINLLMTTLFMRRGLNCSFLYYLDLVNILAK